MIFQEPTTSLNPCFTIGFQLTETLRLHLGLDRKAALATRRRSCSSRSAFRPPSSRLKDFPHQLSGGMNQRVMIAMAIACNPRLLIADEPTTALDVTIQAQILDLLRGLQRERGMALVLVTHNMGVVAEMARRVAVMYAGQVVEERAADALFAAPQHPYTAALLAAMPERSTGERRLATIPGMVPGLYDRPRGCLFAPALRVCDTAHCCRERPDAAPVAGRPGALPLPARRSRPRRRARPRPPASQGPRHERRRRALPADRTTARRAAPVAEAQRPARRSTRSGAA